METAAYYVALMVLLTFPPAVCAWFVVHPFVRFWRRVGPFGTYASVLAFVIAGATAAYLVREPLLRVRFGLRTPLVAVSVVLLAVGVYLRARMRRQLSASTMLGLPEISPGRDGGRLLTDGIYAHTRNPRYLEVGVSLLGCALFSNYLALYVLLAAYVPAIRLVVALEERELGDRFGAAYDEYCRRVPRFFPRLRRR